jgi:hypothetical protein
MFGEAPTANPPGFLAGIRQTLAKKMLGDQTEALAQHYGSRLLVRGKDVPPTIRAIDAVRQSLLKSQQTQQAFSTAAPALVVGQHRALWDLLTGSRR